MSGATHMDFEPSNQPFELTTDFELAGDQPMAIDQLVNALNKGQPYQTLLGVTGSAQDLHDGQRPRPGQPARACPRP